MTAISGSYARFHGERYFAPLDGLRAISILLVVSLHSTDPMWGALHGAVGVTVFFVISGFLITTLLLREERRFGKARIGAFYVRRAFRILPLYYVALVAYLVLIGVMHVKSGAGSFWHALPWYATYQNDFAPVGSGFGHTWSLAVEEKFYLVWPLVFLLPVLRRHRLVAVVVATLLAAVSVLSPSTLYLATYVPILLGCLLALMMDQPAGFTIVRRAANTPVALLLLTAMILELVWLENDSHIHLAFAVLCAALFPAVLVGPRWLDAALTNRVLVYIGKRSYAVYLIHRIAKGAVDRVVAPGATSVPHELTHTVLIVLLALAGAEALARTIEQPMIRLGRRLSGTPRSARTVPSTA